MVLWTEGVAGSGASMLLQGLLGLYESIVWTDGVPAEFPSPSPVRSMTAQSGFDSPASHVGGILHPGGGVR